MLSWNNSATSGSEPGFGLAWRSGAGGLLLVLACLAGCAAGSTAESGSPASMVDRAGVHLDLARGYLDGENPARARDPLLRALELDPERVEAHVLAGVLYEREQETELAEYHFRAALELDPADPQALNNYGAFLYGQGRFRDALEPLQRASRNAEYRLRAQVYENLGLTELALGRPDAARNAFERALGLGASQPRSTLELASIHYSQHDYDAAERYYHDFLADAGETTRSACLGLRLAGVEGATLRSVDHAERLRMRFPRAISSCR